MRPESLFIIVLRLKMRVDDTETDIIWRVQRTKLHFDDVLDRHAVSSQPEKKIATKLNKTQIGNLSQNAVSVKMFFFALIS